MARPPNAYTAAAPVTKYTIIIFRSMYSCTNHDISVAPEFVLPRGLHVVHSRVGFCKQEAGDGQKIGGPYWVTPDGGPVNVDTHADCLANGNTKCVPAASATTHTHAAHTHATVSYYGNDNGNDNDNIAAESYE